jgi:hypothetical protein
MRILTTARNAFDTRMTLGDLAATFRAGNATIRFSNVTRKWRLEPGACVAGVPSSNEDVKRKLL